MLNSIILYPIDYINPTELRFINDTTDKKRVEKSVQKLSNARERACIRIALLCFHFSFHVLKDPKVDSSLQN